tara:strand:- start:1235 stop:1693 length:459 start_codon:yes stop_codon:yes gene_type:complete
MSDLKEQFSPLFEYIYKGNKDAISLSLALLKIAHTWDDLIDNDKEVSNATIDSAFLASTIDLTLNPLWDECLAYNLLNVYIRWNCANKIEKNINSTNNELAKAWCLRAGLYDLFSLIATRLYGLGWGLSINEDVYNFYGETLKDFIKEIRNA